MICAGNIIGVPAAINGSYSATAKAVVDSELGVISGARFLELLENTPELCRAAMRMMSQEVARLRFSVDEHCILSSTNCDAGGIRNAGPF